MKSLFIFCLLSLFYFRATAQPKEIFTDDFSNNQNKWTTGEIEKLFIKIENGKYIIDSKLISNVNPQVLAAVDSSKDFSIGVTVNPVSLYGQAECGLIFGSNRYAYYCFTIDTKGNYGLYYVINNTIKEIIPVSATKYLKKGTNTTSRLEVRKSGKKWNLFINDSLVNSTASKKFYGPFIGVTNENQKTEFDDLKVAGTAVVTSGNICALFPLIFQSAKNNFEYIKGNPLQQDDTVIYNLSVHLKEDEYVEVSFFPGKNHFYATLKNDNISAAAAVKYNDNLVVQMKKCLPGYVFTKSKDEKGLPQYIIKEKTSSPAEQPAVTLGITKSAAFMTTLVIISKPVKQAEPIAPAKPVAEEEKPTSGWIVNDYFKNNEGNWLIDSNSEAKYSIDPGFSYSMSTKTDKSKIVLNTFHIPNNESHDYKIETVVLNFVAKDKSPFGLIFGKHMGAGFYFLITNDGYFSIKSSKDTTINIIKDFTYSSAIHIAEEVLSFQNTLTVIKIKNTWSFRINGREVYNCAAQPLGEKFGFLVPGNGLLQAQSFKIYDWTLAENFPNQPGEIICSNKFYDNLHSNKNGWDELNSTTTKSYFPHLDYRIQHKSDGYFMPALAMPSSNLIDFRIELVASHIKGTTDKQFGICFGKKDIDNAYTFTIAADGTYEIGKFINGEWTSIYKGDNDVIRKGDYSTNTLTIEQTKGKWNFYINHKNVHVFYSSILPGDKAGCFIEGNQEVGFESFSYDEIEYREK